MGWGSSVVQPHAEADWPDARLSLGPDPASVVLKAQVGLPWDLGHSLCQLQLHPWKPYKQEPGLRAGFSPGLGSGCSAILLASSLPSSDPCRQTSFITGSYVPRWLWSGSFLEWDTSPVESRDPICKATVGRHRADLGMEGRDGQALLSGGSQLTAGTAMLTACV